MPPLDFTALNGDQAETFLARYVAASDERLNWFRERTGLAAESERAALVEAWSWYLRWSAGGEHEPVTEPPMWWVADPSDADGLLSYEALCLIDGIGYHWASVLIADRPHLAWRAYPARRHRGMTIHCAYQPALVPRGAEASLPLTPVHIVYGGALAAKRAATDPHHAGGLEREAVEPEHLARRHDYWIDQVDRVMDL